MNLFRRQREPEAPAQPAIAELRTVCPYCGVGCGMKLRVENGRVVDLVGDKEHPANFGRLCAKGFAAAKPLYAPDRLAFAHVRASRQAPLERVSLGRALDAVGDRLRRFVERDGPDAVALYSSGQVSMEAQYLGAKLFKGFLRTNNVDSNSRLCMSSAASGYKQSLGADAPPGAYGDIERADVFLVIGANMAECHPILFLRVLDRRKVGARMVVVDPRRTPTADKADLFLQIAPGTDLALLNGLLHLIIKKGRTDPDFIARHTEGWPELAAFIEDYTPDRVAAITGLPEKDIRLAAKWIGELPEFVTFWTMGLNQSVRGTWHTNAICNLHLATGKICRPGSGPFSLTGQPNAMGGREVGYLSHTLPGQRSVTSPADRAFVERLWGVPEGTLRAEPGADATTLFKKMEAGDVKALWIIGSNPAVSMPKRDRVIEGLLRAELVIVQDAYHPTETSAYADILLPGALWAEAEGTMVNSERTVTLMPSAIPPPGDGRADWWLIAEVARRMGFGGAFDYARAGDVFDEIRQTWNPASGYDLRGISYEKLRRRPMQWPCAPNAETGAPIRFVQPGRGLVSFPTDSGKARFLARPWQPPDDKPDAAFPLVLTTGRVANQWHTLTKTGKVEALNKLHPGPFLELHPDDAAAIGASEGTPVQVRSVRGAAVFPARITERVRRGACFAPFHWNDLYGENLAVNAVTSEAVDPVSLQPALKYATVSVSVANGDSPDDFTPEQGRVLAGLIHSAPEGFAPDFTTLSKILVESPLTELQQRRLAGLFVVRYTAPR